MKRLKLPNQRPPSNRIDTVLERYLYRRTLTKTEALRRLKALQAPLEWIEVIRRMEKPHD
jgi:hypothetical protein